MDGQDEVLDSSTGWVATHVRRYLASDGASGHIWYGKPTLVLTTRGRTSGALRRTGLIYGEDGGNFVVVGSNGGSDRNPQWYLNLLADPRARIQVAADVHEVVAREAEGEERDRLWDAMVAIFPQYKSYRKKTERRIPVVVLEPRDS
ncbi:MULTISPECIES: nitroreductase family deazaflavin-dependent oxidoreductase [Streptomyces]|uniref:Nitroreductase n=2 Tax=Streptomyces cinereoruber TaxID=67260 RepID=A0AAV4KFD1_9ACTN|nr:MULTISPECIES: nitroreductase family deazaflavin-dependent oxidoreductase [Streptomyces]AVH94698.1 nitroreductase family deazaflavin-dependent oxidoreductase [Streptomyces sp. WAC00288]KYG53423.1 nitroreductase [Streptomyces sp. WAC04657]MBB4157643.1 deazaflavin-dependent oxidoreductase (nitroreductase family) [Streptomyces cinereoruber]MBY8816436.1 nitroreductase family deazaflavin-dependent oxidoreductase [Streptomyces cinereoruber]NIH62204.1 deazaflavin-dependent oxidoreductase (nitroredu